MTPIFEKLRSAINQGNMEIAHENGFVFLNLPPLSEVEKDFLDLCLLWNEDLDIDEWSLGHHLKLLIRNPELHSERAAKNAAIIFIDATLNRIDDALGLSNVGNPTIFAQSVEIDAMQRSDLDELLELSFVKLRKALPLDQLRDFRIQKFYVPSEYIEAQDASDAQLQGVGAEMLNLPQRRASMVERGVQMSGNFKGNAGMAADALDDNISPQLHSLEFEGAGAIAFLRHVGLGGRLLQELKPRDLRQLRSAKDTLLRLG